MLQGDDLEAGILDTQYMLDSFGRRMATFLGAQSTICALEQAWCDAAYWFHQGLSEPLDTIAVAKLETAMESLFVAENTRGSEHRISRALQAILGHTETSAQRADGTMFARRVVEARSRFLHGTRSTTRDDVGVDRRSVEEVVRLLILCCSVRLDEYAKEEEVSDHVEAFLEWAEATQT